MTLLETKGLSKRVTAERWLFRGLNLCVSAGEQLAMQGASGVGKSTLLHLLAGLDRPDEGQVRYRGRDVADMSQAERLALRRNTFGFVFQAFHLMPHLSAIQNVMVPCLLSDMPASQARADAHHLLVELGLKDSVNLFPSVLSGGEQQRVALARALVHRPEIVLADEPTGNLDRHTANTVFELMLQLAADQGTALVMVTHDTELAARCARQHRLVAGRFTENAATTA